MTLLELTNLWPPFASLQSGGGTVLPPADDQPGGPPTEYDVGDVVRCYVQFTNPLNNDAAVNPDTVRFAIRTPAGDVTVRQYGVGDEVMKLGAGLYATDVEFDDHGRWYVRGYSSGIGQAAIEMRLTVKQHRAM